MAHCGWAGVAFGKGIASDAAMRHKGDPCLRSPQNNFDKFFRGPHKTNAGCCMMQHPAFSNRTNRLITQQQLRLREPRQQEQPPRP